MADTIKTLSDRGVNASVLIVGVADSVAELISSHASVERALVQIPMPRMSPAEIRQIITTGLTRLTMNIEQNALDQMVSLSQGLPYITHLLGLHTSRAAFGRRSKQVNSSDVDNGIERALEKWQQSVRNAYYIAVNSSQPGNIFRDVLLACALAEPDDLGYFSAAGIRAPLRQITGKDYDIPNFARHLKLFSEASRGDIIERIGETRRLRYRFISPLMRPYIVMRAYSDGLLKRSIIMKKVS